MSGHSKWSTIKRKKGAADAKRGKVFSKLIKELTVAARMGGGDPAGNPRLRSAIQIARGQNMPNDNIERAIKKGTGELEGTSYDEITYEGYGPGGVAILVEVMTDNKQRTVPEMRHTFTKYHGNLGESGCVAWNFETKGIMAIDTDQVSEDKLMELAIDAGAEDVRKVGSSFEVLTDPKDFEQVKEKLEGSQLKFALAEVAKLPKTTTKLEGKQAEQMIKLIEALEDNEDVQNVYNNSDISEEDMEKIAGA